MLRHEIGLRWMSLELRLQIERIEELLRSSGYARITLSRVTKAR